MMNVFDYFFENCENFDKNFVIGNNETISYRSLYDNSLKIASYLNENFGENKNILIISKNSLFFITAYLGILKSGNICVPLDFSIEDRNFEYIFNITNCQIIFCEKSIKKKLNIKDGTKIIDQDDLKEIVLKQRILDFDFSFDHNQLAEMIFTSGSTGKPKGVMLTHLNIISNTNSIVEYLDLSHDDIVLVVLPFYYCYGLSLLHTHLRVGGSIVLNNQFLFLGTVINDLKVYNCTGFSGVPSHFQMLLKKSKSFMDSDFPALRYVTQAGGKLHNTFINDFIRNFTNIKFYTMYGQTEATARLSYLPSELVSERLGSIGKGIPGVELRVVNKKGEKVKENEIGEIIAKGGNIMKGYYQDNELTNKTLINRWLYTGDLAKKDTDGFIYIVARKKEILKIGGKRVSPKEIEEVILSVYSVVDCTISGVNDDVLGESLLALVVINQIENKNQIKNKILEVCNKKLSSHKIPGKFEFSDNITVKSSGKKVNNNKL